MDLFAAYWTVYKKLTIGLDAVMVNAKNQNGATIIIAIVFFYHYHVIYRFGKHTDNIESQV